MASFQLCSILEGIGQFWGEVCEETPVGGIYLWPTKDQPGALRGFWLGDKTWEQKS